MNRSNITSATVFPKLRLILQEDIRVLEQLKSKRKKDSDMYELTDSLITAKSKILEKFPSKGQGFGNSVTTASKLYIVGHGSKRDKGDSSMISALSSIEKDQMEFVKNAVVEEGMPDEMVSDLKEILDIYESITDQLNRARKTNQINTVIV
jgi:hypothetical protein